MAADDIGIECYEFVGLNHPRRRFLEPRVGPWPGDIYCALWGLLALAGIGDEEWTPQYSYWRRPATLEDGGANPAD